MQKNVGKNTKKLYLTTAIISCVLVLAIALTLVFTLGGRSIGGSGNGTNSGTVGSITTELTKDNGTITTGKGLEADTTTEYNIKVKNTSGIPVYIRVNVIFEESSSATGNYFNYDETMWTYASDNYLYYSDKVEKNAVTSSFFTTANVAGTYRFIVEALQKEAAVPEVDISGVSVTTGTSSSSSKAIQYGLLQQYGTLTALSDDNKNDTKVITITNTGQQDLDVKFRIASSEWMVESATVNGTSRTVDWYPNAGYYQLVGKLAVGEIATITLGDANKNNNIVAGETQIYFIFQDYAVATDLYSLVDSSLQNVSTKVANENYTYTIPAGKGSDLYVYSYNNADKFVYVQISGTTESYTLNSAWGKFEGESTGVSGTVISPKSKSEKLFDTAPTGTFTIKVWTAQKIDNATISVISGATLNGSSNNYQPVNDATGTKVTTDTMILPAGTSYTESNITSKWGSLAIKSGDSSDMLVRVSLSFSWGTYSGGTWTPSTDALGFSPSVFYGDGFSFNSEDQSLTYNYNLSNGQATSALLDFTDTATSGTTRATELATMLTEINKGGRALKLSIMVEAIYAVGSQLDILKLTGTPTSASGSYYTTDEIESKSSSMTKTSTMITGDASTLAENLSKYVVYVTNNFPVGVRVAVALQWGTLSGSTWTPSTTNPNSSVNLGQYLSSNWTFDEALGGYNYICSIPGKCATLSIFDSNKLSGLATGLATEASSHSGETLRVIIMAETTHKV